MNHEKEYSKTAAPGCEVCRVKALSSEGRFLPKSALKERRKPLKEGVERNAAGKVCGSSKHSAKIDEDAVRAIRAHKRGSTCIYAMTAKQAAERFGISESSVSSIRSRRTWGHVA